MAKSDDSERRVQWMFAASDPGFVSNLADVSRVDWLERFARKWTTDKRPWARQQVCRYLLDDQFHVSGHETLFRILFRHFEAAGDHEVMAAYLVALDRIVHRRAVTVQQFDYENRRPVRFQVLRAEADRVRPNRPGTSMATDNAEHVGACEQRRQYRLFSNRTRNYLRRRVWRYFRRLSDADPAGYITAVSTALVEFTDAELSSIQRTFDHWSLMHACWFSHPVVRFGVAHASLADSSATFDYAPAPWCPDAWQLPSSAAVLLNLELLAESAVIRQWAAALREQWHAGAEPVLDAGSLVRLLAHPQAALQQAGFERLKNHPERNSWKAAQKVELVAAVDDAIRESVRELLCPEPQLQNLSPSELAAVCCGRDVQLARNCFDELRQRDAERPLTDEQMSELSRVRCAGLATEVAQWCLQQYSHPDDLEPEHVLPFFESPVPEVRAAAASWLQAEGCPAAEVPSVLTALWMRSDENLHRIVRELLKRVCRSAPHVENGNANTPDDASLLWAETLLACDRGGRSAGRLLARIAVTVADSPDTAETGLGVLAAAAQSARREIAGRALSELARLLTGQPDLERVVKRWLPSFSADGVLSQP